MMLMFCLAPAAAQTAEHGAVSLIVENDSFHDQIDRHYTNGLLLSYTGKPLAPAEAPLGAWVADNLLLPGRADAQLREGWQLGQSIFTPENLLAKVPSVNDRPYAGWLYGGWRLLRDSGAVLDRFDVTVGVVGPASLGEDLQKWWHSAGIFGGQPAQGWGYQLRDEPGLVLSEQRIWRVPLATGPLEAEALPQANFAVGNIFDYAAAGGSLRIGQGLAADWGAPRIAPGLAGADTRTGRDWGWYLFAGAEGRAVARNLFLDGNSFQSSRSVRRQTLVADLQAGLAILMPWGRFSVTYVNRTREFAGQRGNDEILSGGLSLAVN